MTYVERTLRLMNGPPWGFRLYEDFMEGLIVSKIRRQSPADQAGMVEGDHVIAIDGLDALDMSHTRAVQMVDFASYTLEIVVGRYERLQKMETIYLDNRSLHRQQKPQEITTSELQLFWEKQTPLRASRMAGPAPQPSPPPPAPMVILPSRPIQPAFVQAVNRAPPPPQPRAMTIHIPPPPPPAPPGPQPMFVRQPSPDPLDWKIIPNDPDVSSVSVKQLLREFHAPPIAPALRKKNYADSSFYSDPNRYYPTIEEQIEMAHKVAGSLQDPENVYSKGVNMFEKQRVRANKHVREGPEPERDPILEACERHARAGVKSDSTEPENIGVRPATPEELEYMTPPSPPPPPPPPPPSFPGLQPVTKPNYPIPPPPPLLPGQPKTVQEFLEKIKVFPSNRHTDLDPQKCFDISTALYVSDSRGAKMFAKRHARAKKWDAQAPPESAGGQSAEATLASAPGPTAHDPMKLKLLSKLPHEVSPLPVRAAPFKPTPIAMDFGGAESGMDMSRKPRISLVDDRVQTQTPINLGSMEGGAGGLIEGTPKPFGSALQPTFMDIDADAKSSTASGWRPVEFKLSQPAPEPTATVEEPAEANEE